MKTMIPNITVEPILTEDRIEKVEIPHITEVEIPEVLKVPEAEPILTKDHITKVEIPEVVVTEGHITKVEMPHVVEAEIPEAATLEVPVVKRLRKRRNTRKAKMEKYGPMPGVRIKRIKKILRLVYLSEV